MFDIAQPTVLQQAVLRVCHVDGRSQNVHALDFHATELAQIARIVPLLDLYHMARRRLPILRPQVHRARLLIQKPFPWAVQPRQAPHQQVWVPRSRLIGVLLVVLVLPDLLGGDVEAKGLAGLVVRHPARHVDPLAAGPENHHRAIPVASGQLRISQPLVARPFCGRRALHRHQITQWRVRPARFGHHLPVHEKLHELQVCLQPVDVPAVLLPRPRQRVRATEHHLLARQGYKPDRLPRLTRLPRPQRLAISARPQVHRIARPRHRASLPQRRPRLRLGARADIVPLRRDIVIRRHGASHHQEACHQKQLSRSHRFLSYEQQWIIQVSSRVPPECIAERKADRWRGWRQTQSPWDGSGTSLRVG